MLRKVAICALLASAVLAVGCGNSEDSTSESDEQAVRELVDKINEASELKDGSRFCLLISPSEIDDAFNGDIDKCVRQTNKVLQVDEGSPAPDREQMRIENIEIDGNVATVSMEGEPGGEAKFVKEDGEWYLPLDQGNIASSGTDGSTD